MPRLKKDGASILWNIEKYSPQKLGVFEENGEFGRTPARGLVRKIGLMSGFNTDIEHAGSEFHVQTQDQGACAHYVESVIYRSGKVLSSRRTYYATFLNSPDLNSKICEIIQEQHSTILREITEGRFDHL